MAIIDNPDQFLSDVENSIGREIKHGEVQYFYIDEGLPTDDGRRALDMQYIKYLVQDAPPVVENGKTTCRFLAKHVYRSLLCKDVFFRDEQEYRLILLNDKILVVLHQIHSALATVCYHIDRKVYQYLSVDYILGLFRKTAGQLYLKKNSIFFAKTNV